MNREMHSNRLFRSILIAFCGFIFGFSSLSGESLENSSVKIAISDNGQIQSIHDRRLDHTYRIHRDFFTIAADRDTFSSDGARVLRVEKSRDRIAYFFQFTTSRTIRLEYFLRPEAAYVERFLTVSAGNEPVTLVCIESGRTTFSSAPGEVLVYDTFWNASTVTFIRWEKSGLFCGIENPFFKTTHSGATVSFKYEPSLILGSSETYRSDSQFIGIYGRSGKVISDYHPQTIYGHRPRFRNPDGHKALDLCEIRAMQRFAADYLDVSLNDFKFINYHFFYPLPQMPLPDTPEEKLLLKVVQTFGDLGGDLFMFNPMYPYSLPVENDTSYWEFGPDGSSSKKIMDEAGTRNIGSGFYSGCGRYGAKGNASALPFVPERTDWKKTDEKQNRAAENCMACDEFADWWFRVQNNTIVKYGLKLWSWDPGPGNGKFCFNQNHGHLPGKGEYKGWRNASLVMQRLKENHPDLFLMAFYGRKEYGLWGFKYFDQHESYWELTIPYGSSIHPDLHADRVNAGIRMQGWWNQNFRFMPPQINHVLAHRIQEGFWDPRLPLAWDHIGWKYSLVSGLASGGGIMTVILPENLDDVPGMKEFYAKWLKWGRDNFYLSKYDVAFGEQLRIGGIDGRARISQGHGFIFLCNQNPRPTRISFNLNEEIGLYQDGTWSLREAYPHEGNFFFDDGHSGGIFKTGDTIECVVPAYQIVLMELTTVKTGQKVVIPDMDLLKDHLTEKYAAPVRFLDHWTTVNGEEYSFPFHDSACNIELTTSFFADEKIQRLLEASRPHNLDDYESLIPAWKNEFPDNFAWARPDRLWLVIPSANAARVKDPELSVNGKNITVECHLIGRPIIHYADITDFISWNRENKIVLQFGHIEQNQFLGPYLDYPEFDDSVPDGAGLCSLTPVLYSNSIVYNRVIDPDKPACIMDEAGRGPVIQNAEMVPDFFYPGQKVRISVKLSRPSEEIETVMISLPYADAEMTFNKDAGNWEIQYTPGGREGLIMDVSFLRVWAIAKNGCISESADIPINWHFAR